MLSAVVLLCLSASACTPQTAFQTMIAPEQYASPSACAARGQSLLASTMLGRDMAGVTVMIRCRPAKKEARG